MVAIIFMSVNVECSDCLFNNQLWHLEKTINLESVSPVAVILASYIVDVQYPINISQVHTLHTLGEGPVNIGLPLAFLQVDYAAGDVTAVPTAGMTNDPGDIFKSRISRVHIGDSFEAVITWVLLEDKSETIG